MAETGRARWPHRAKLAACAFTATLALSSAARADDAQEGRENQEAEQAPAPQPSPEPPPPPPSPAKTPVFPAGMDEEEPAAKKPAASDDETFDEPLVTGTARLADRFYEGGPFVGSGGPLAVSGLTSSVGLTGVRVLENHGYISKFTIAMLMAMGQSNGRYVGSTYHRDSRGNTWRTDYYRPLTAAERRAQQEAMRAAISAEYVMELNVYTTGLFGLGGDDRARARGFEFYLGGHVPLGKGEGHDLPTILQIAFVGSHVHAPNVEFEAGKGPNGEGTTTVHRQHIYYTNLGVMLRAIIPITAWAEGYLHWDANVLSLFDLSGKKLREKGYVWTSPVRAGLNFNLTDRAYVRGHASLNGFGTHGLGWHAEAGIRF